MKVAHAGRCRRCCGRFGRGFCLVVDIFSTAASPDAGPPSRALPPSVAPPIPPAHPRCFQEHPQLLQIRVCLKVPSKRSGSASATRWNVVYCNGCDTDVYARRDTRSEPAPPPRPHVTDAAPLDTKQGRESNKMPSRLHAPSLSSSSSSLSLSLFLRTDSHPFNLDPALNLPTHPLTAARGLSRRPLQFAALSQHQRAAARRRRDRIGTAEAAVLFGVQDPAARRSRRPGRGRVCRAR